MSARDRPGRLSNSRPASSKARFLLVASTLTSTWSAGRMEARRFMAILDAIMHRLAQTLINMFQGVKNPPFGRLRNAGHATPAQDDSSSRHHATAGIRMVILHAVLVADRKSGVKGKRV